MHSIILKFIEDDIIKFIIIPADATVDVRNFINSSYDEVKETLIADEIPCELWDRPVELPPFLT